ncbi:hypothetical protein ACIHAX_36390 [Nocardia sp. NPDC051929]
MGDFHPAFGVEQSQWQMQCALDVPGGPLLIVADIQQHSLRRGRGRSLVG